MVYIVKCAECKEIDLCINRATVVNDTVKTELSSVGHTHVYFCTTCRADEFTNSGGLTIWGKKTKEKRNANN